MSPRDKAMYNEGFRRGALEALEAIDEVESVRAKRWAKLRDHLKRAAGAPAAEPSSVDKDAKR